LLADVQRHVMQADGKKSQGEQQRHIARLRQANALERRDHGHEQRRQEKPQQRQMPGVVGLQADVNAGG